MRKKIELKACPKTYILETHRSRTPASTLDAIHRLGETVGVLSFRDATHEDRIGIPVFLCERVRPDNSKTSHTGKGVSREQAQVSVMMEAIERYSSEFRPEAMEKLIRGTPRELRDKFNTLDPCELILPQFAGPYLDRELSWTWGHDISNGEDILVPASAVYHPFHMDELPLISTNTNGLASGSTLEEAIFHGMTEVIERDAWSIAKFTGVMDDALLVEDDPGQAFLVAIIRKFEDARLQLTAKDITSDIGVPVVAAFCEDLLHPQMIPIDGFGAHLDPRVAMARALLELTTTRALFLNKYGVSGLREPLACGWGEEVGEDPRFYARRTRGLGEMENVAGDDIFHDIQILLAKLRARGLERTIVVDLTRSEVGIPTVRVIIPGMEVTCFDRTRRGERLFTSQGARH